MNPQNYTINIRPGWGISPVVKVSQGDVGRPLAFTIMDGQDALTIASGTTVTIKGTKPSTLGFTQTCELSGNTASVETTATMTQEAGAVQAELILTQGTTVIGSANFVMYVEPAAHPEGTTDGDAETARDLMTRAEQAVEQAEAAAEQAEASAEAISQAGIDTTGATAGQVPTANGAGGWTWEDPQGAGGGTSDDIENASSVSGSTVSDALNSLSDDLANKGTYSKPSGGIPKSDLASAVQTSLAKADTALQTAPVSSVNGKTGVVVLTSDDINNNSGVSGTTVGEALDELDDGKENATSIVTMTASQTSQNLAKNYFYVWPEMTSLTITCPSTGGPYAFRFTSGSTATTLTMSGITMPDDFTVEANKVYEINVYQGYGLAASWAVS